MCAVIALKGYLMACEVWKLVLGTNFNCFSTFFIEAGFQLNSELITSSGDPCLCWNCRWVDHYAHLIVMFILEHSPRSFFLLLHDYLFFFFLPLLFGAILDVCLHGIIFPFLSGLFHFVLKVYHIITCMRILSLS